MEKVCPTVDSLSTLFPNDAELCLQRGLCLSAEQQDSEATRYLDYALKYADDQQCDIKQRAWEEKGLIERSGFKNYSQAYECFLRAYQFAVSCPPIDRWDSTINLYNAAHCAIAYHNFHGADSIANVLKSQFPDNPDGYEVRAHLFETQLEIDKAILEYDTILQLVGRASPSDQMRYEYFSRANLYQRKGDLTSACTDWQKALELGLEDAKPKLDSFCSGK